MQPPVKLYALSTCPHCNATKRFLDDCHVAYDATDVDLLYGEERQAILEEVRKLNERCTFPTLVIGDRVIVGFQEAKIKEALGIA